MVKATTRSAGYDWPSGDLDLKIHDLPHESSDTEWWYVNSHLVSESGRNFSVFAAFFRVKVADKLRVNDESHSHSLVWGLIDADNNKYYQSSYFENTAPAILSNKLKNGEGPSDPHIRKALKEMLERDTLPLPDRLLIRPPTIAKDCLHLDFDGDIFEKIADDKYRLYVQCDKHDIECDLIFSPKKKFILHGDNGVVSGVDGEDMFYYFNPRCDVTGAVNVKEENHQLQKSLGWYDHEFGFGGSQSSESKVGWSWLSTQLDNGTELSVYDLFDTGDKSINCGHWGVFIDQDGNSHRFTEFNLVPVKIWRGYSTFTDYPVSWELEIPSLKINLEVTASFNEQEFITSNSEPSIWEGRVAVSGSVNGESIAGPGFVECAGYGITDNMDDFYARVGETTQEMVAKLLPIKPSINEMQALIGHEHNPEIAYAIDPEQYSRIFIQPLRDILDRGGKAWRSYALLLSIEIVGGNPDDFVDFLALPELMHTGSLIIDDVQDNSSVRRGGPSCHVTHGLPLAINSGCAAYFIGEVLCKRLPEKTQLAIYKIYFDSMRAGHTGQALDIAGLSDIVTNLIDNNQESSLLDRVLITHRLKSAVPARSIAKIGAIIGGASDSQVELLGNYAEALGLAFQIVDDVLNLRGFKGKLKERGEDLREGKATVPVVIALGNIPHLEAKELWDSIDCKPQDESEIEKIIGKIEQCGALDDSMKLATDIIDSAWAKLEPHFSDSFAKLRFRSFGFYLLERHY